jgi:glycosyltransferase involved in cell wall biosynthesis
MNKILEYNGLEKAIVQFDLVEGRRSAGDAAVYARPNEVGDLAAKIVALLDDPQRRARMGAERRRVEERLEWRHQDPRLLDAYRRAMSNRIGRFEDATGHRLQCRASQDV